jgi:hypothetical protein
MNQFITDGAVECLKNNKEYYGTDWRGNIKLQIILKRKYAHIEINNKKVKIEKTFLLNEIKKYIGDSSISSIYNILNDYYNQL